MIGQSGIATSNAALLRQYSQRIQTSGTPVDPLALFYEGRRVELTPFPFKLFWYMYEVFLKTGRNYFDYKELGAAIWGDANKKTSCIGATARQIRNKLEQLGAPLKIHVCADGLEIGLR